MAHASWPSEGPAHSRAQCRRGGRGAGKGGGAAAQRLGPYPGRGPRVAVKHQPCTPLLFDHLIH